MPVLLFWFQNHQQYLILHSLMFLIEISSPLSCDCLSPLIQYQDGIQLSCPSTCNADRNKWITIVPNESALNSP